MSLQAESKSTASKAEIIDAFERTPDRWNTNHNGSSGGTSVPSVGVRYNERRLRPLDRIADQMMDN